MVVVLDIKAEWYNIKKMLGVVEYKEYIKFVFSEENFVGFL